MFFFSSRRRHTRFDCDWSSDVCSSDLGLERRRVAGQEVGEINSVASFFVSRVDGRVDPQLDAGGDPHKLRGTIAIANAGMAYAAFERSRATPRWGMLAEAGARPQRPLWASTSTK